MKTLLFVFAVMYVIGEVVSFAGFWVYNHLTREQLDTVRGVMTWNMLSTCARYVDGKDYLKWAILGAPFRFVLSPLSMIIVIGILFETVIYNLDIL